MHIDGTYCVMVETFCCFIQYVKTKIWMVYQLHIVSWKTRLKKIWNFFMKIWIEKMIDIKKL
jgi:hypothetical protein